MRKPLIVALLALTLGLGACCRAQAADDAKPAGKKPGAPAARYDVLYQFHMPTFAEWIVGAVEKAAAKEFGRQKSGESDEDYAIRKQFGENLKSGVVQAIKDLDDVSLGWRLDRNEKRTYVDLTFTAQSGTPLAQRFAQAKSLKTGFAGFRLPGAALRAHWVGQAPQAEAAASAKLVQMLREKELKKLDREGVSDDEKRIRKDLLNQIFDVLRDTAASGRSDGALSLAASPNGATLVAGGYVADGAKLQNVVRTVGEFLQNNHPAFSSLKLDAEQFEGVTFHTLAFPAPPVGDRDQFVRAFGETLDVVLGFGKEAVYLAAGKDAMKTLKEAIRKSATPAPAPNPFEVSLALKPVAAFVGAFGRDHEKGVAQMVTATLDRAKGKDHLRLVVRTTERGATVRFDVEQGILELIHAAHPRVGAFLLGQQAGAQ
ncbi:MAG: hypothetical protein NUV77_20230 [Thermoguttaceae bacterium]|nr:hypothetical protein [Thermoguttaceae bacterium]